MPDVDKGVYRIYDADGEHFYDFKYRVGGSPDNVKYLAVIMDGVSGDDVQVTQLYYASSGSSVYVSLGRVVLLLMVAISCVFALC